MSAKLTYKPHPSSLEFNANIWPQSGPGSHRVALACARNAMAAHHEANMDAAIRRLFEVGASLTLSTFCFEHKRV